MDRSGLPNSAFIAPDGDNANAVRTLTEAIIDQLLDQLTTADDRSPLPSEPAVPSVDVPETARPLDTLLDEIETIVSGSMNPAHPGYIGHMDTIPTTASILGDLVAAAINNNMLSVEMSPILSELEVAVIEQFTDDFGLGPDASGVMTAGGSLANLQALAVARNRAFDALDAGVINRDRQPVLFASEVAHTSLQKAAMLLGLGTEAVIPVETDENTQLRPDALRTAIHRAEAHDQTPFCVVGTAGTTTTGNIDPLGELHEIAATNDLWFHVDAAYGGALVFSERERHRLTGIEHADSITVNPQKWLYVAKTCAMVLFRDADRLQSDFRVGVPYMRGDDAIPNLGEVSVQGTRHADILKLWLALQHIGLQGFAQLIDESYRLTEYVVTAIENRETLELASQPEMNIVCFRAAPDWSAPTEYDDLNARLQHSLLRDANVFVSLPTYREEHWLRAVLLNPYTDTGTLDRLFGYIDAFLENE